jgi:hypothetical protein
LSAGKFGSTGLTAQGSDDAFAAELDKSGNWLWAASARGSSLDSGQGMGVDSAGNSYITGSFTGQAKFGSKTLTAQSSYFDLFVWKLAAAGP